MPAGLIQNQLDDSQTQIAAPAANNIAIANSTTYDPEKRTVDAGKETVAGQMTDLLATGSPYMTRARTDAAETANSRGLINSSMAVGAGEDAAIRSALPIASADASTYSTAASQNQQATNTALTQGAQSASNAQLVNAAAGNASALQNMRGDQATNLANIEAQYKNVIQASAAGGKLYSDAVTSITSILSSVDTSPEQKQLAVEKITQMLQSGLNVVGSMGNLDLGGLLDFTNVNSGIVPPPPPPTTPVTSAQWDQWLNGGATFSSNVPPVPSAYPDTDASGNEIWNDPVSGKMWPRR